MTKGPRPFETSLARLVALLVLLICGLGSNMRASASDSANALPQRTSRPPQVPEDYVISPFGYFHPSCVRNVPDGAIVMDDGRIQQADGSVDVSVPVCFYPHYSPDGTLVSPNNVGGANAPPVGCSPPSSCWVEDISATATTGPPLLWEAHLSLGRAAATEIQ